MEEFENKNRKIKDFEDKILKTKEFELQDFEYRNHKVFKIVVVGEIETGKTSIIRQYAQ
jgi:predicted GTPase